jgi:hypothetical protein
MIQNSIGKPNSPGNAPIPADQGDEISVQAIKCRGDALFQCDEGNENCRGNGENDGIRSHS